MGGINRHPTCRHTWELTTLGSKSLSDGVASLMEANSLLETVLLAEFHGTTDLDAAGRMPEKLRQAKQCFTQAKDLIKKAIPVAQKNPDDFAEARSKIDPTILALQWDDTLVIGNLDNTERIAGEIKQDRLSTSHRFIAMLTEIEESFAPAINAFEQASMAATNNNLETALASNTIPLQRTFGRLFSLVLQFMNEYLIDSLVATQVSFDQRRHPALVMETDRIAATS